MTRYARLHLPGLVHHVIARFVNRAFRLAGEPERLEYLRRLGKHLGECDWRLLAYALMSSYVHLVLRAGTEPSARLIAPLHTGFAGWLNRRQGHLGPVFASRHTTIGFDDAHAAALLAYVHNNPVRAGVVTHPAESPWTSHRAYVGLQQAPPWLDVDEGLRLVGIDGGSPDARERFDELVAAGRQSGRNASWSNEPSADQRAARLGAGAPVQVSWPLVDDDGRQFLVRRAGPLRPRWPGTAARVVHLVARHFATSAAELSGRGRAHLLVRARRVAMVAWAKGLGRSQAEMAGQLCLSEAAASRFVHGAASAAPTVQRDAELIVAICWDEVAEKANGLVVKVEE